MHSLISIPLARQTLLSGNNFMVQLRSGELLGLNGNCGPQSWAKYNIAKLANLNMRTNLSSKM
jgi:hypothetical protein